MRCAARARHVASLFAASLALLAVLFPSPVAGQGVAAEPWVQITTDHFRVHAPRRLEVIARDAATMAERARELLAAHLRPPQRRTHAVITDAFDAANGSAGVVPRPVITLYAYPPETRSTLGHHDNWLWNLVAHEYVHIAHMSTMGRGWQVLNAPGRRFVPNQALPRWLVEGLATWQESVLSGTGRLASPLFTTQLRTASLAGAEPALGALSGYPGDWPFAGGWYLFGAFFVEWLAEQHGDDAVWEFVERYGRRALPYGVNAVAIECFGADVASLYARFLAAHRVAAARWAAARALAPLTAWEPVTSGGYQGEAVTASHDGRVVAWVDSDGSRRPAVVVRHDGTEQRLEVDGALDPAVHADGSITFSRSFVAQQVLTRRDLVRAGVGGSQHRISWGARAREPAVSAGGRLAWVTPGDRSTDLAVSTDAGWEVVRVPPYALAGAPTWLDERRVVVSLHRPGRGRDLFVADLARGRWEPLVEGPGEDLDPFAVDGQWVLYASDADGAFEVHAVHVATRRTVVLTRGLTGVFSPALEVAPDGRRWLWAARYGAHGHDVVRTPLAWPPSLAGARMPTSSLTRPLPVDLAPSDNLDVRRRREWRGFVPYRWSPVASTAGDDTTLGVSVLAADVADRHAWTAIVTWSLLHDAPAWAASARTGVLPLGLFASTSRTVGRRERGFFVESRDVPWTERRDTFQLGSDLRVDSLRGLHVLAGSWTLERTAPTALRAWSPSPEDLEPRLPAPARRDHVAVSWSWGDTFRPLDAVTPTGGVALSVGGRWRGRWTGADVDTAELTASMRAYVALRRRAGSALALRLAGGLGTARGASRRLFAVGGPEAQDVLVALAGSLPAGNAHVRGFAPQARVGDRYALLNAEYRLPLLRLHAGYSTLPLVLERLALALFADAGYAGRGLATARDGIAGVGAELRLEATTSYFESVSLRVGVARGIGRDAITDVYALYGWWF